MPESVKKKVFRLKFDKRGFLLKAKNEKEKNKWIEVITVVKNKIIETGEDQGTIQQTNDVESDEGEANIPDANDNSLPNIIRDQ